MPLELRTPLCRFVREFSIAMNEIDPEFLFRQHRLTYLTVRMGEEMALPPADLSDACLAAGLHDLGLLPASPSPVGSRQRVNPHLHAQVAYERLRNCGPLAPAAVILLHHTKSWSHEDDNMTGRETPLASQMLYLSEDLLDSISPQVPIPSQGRNLLRRLHEQAGNTLNPFCVEALGRAQSRPEFWPQLARPPAGPLSGFVEMAQA